MKEPDFAERVYWLVTQIPYGQVATYGQIATYAGSPRAARAVGTLLRHSLENYGELPWQRVLNAQGRISFKGDLGRAELQRALLEAEGISFHQGQCDLRRVRWAPREVFWDVD
ncbi:cysteine methyltransferase [Lujinxingia litoralis]|uniref:Cysteine methyltransferase n=1 Tax=Lujinxingia litoralis TaxID=2211119 RepID=A0A328C558_9DELT|nr:MGMT family protein [Lujinxingia litoralis]RAL21725.1 cysteine methyltransferase [Lujinxingia litoralis]